MADFPNIEADAEGVALMANNQVYDSILTGETQTASLAGAKWMFTPTFSNREGAEARQLRSFLFNQGGTSGRFNYYPSSIDNLGTHLGTGVVDGAAQVGKSLVTKGWDFSQPLLFVAGDYLTINSELKMITSDVASNGAGNATIPITPPLRVSPSDNNAIEVNSPFMIGRLETDDQARLQVSAPVIYNTTLSIVEAF
tara:strand:- start:10798 stop:11388 length:591 start_codon:yes stop_codon:yes gene_type:complete